MARSSLQRAVRTLTTFRGSLNDELDKLVEEGRITAQLRANADEVRLSGNDVAHPEEMTEVTESDAKDSLTFLDDFLDSAIAIPERQRRRKAARDGG
jgi:glutamate-1-semialdehyde aminotransferase